MIVYDGRKTEMVNIAIVGSEEKYWTPELREIACKEIKKILINDDYLEYYNNNPYDVIYPTLISGGCPKGGIDIWAEIIADFIGLEKKIYYPEVKNWEDVCKSSKATDCVYAKKKNGLVICEATLYDCPDKRIGYKTRNERIAQDCDVLYCIDPSSRKWSGGRWTMKRADFYGKETHLIIVEEAQGE